MTSNRPYLLRALYDWIIDNGMTPYILLDADYPGTRVPPDFIQDGKIVLNISPMAVKDLMISQDGLTCSARFSGKSIRLLCPVQAVTAIYARENGHGMIFPEDTKNQDMKAVAGPVPENRKPELKLIK
jgi:stringent starvation protein B